MGTTFSELTGHATWSLVAAQETRPYASTVMFSPSPKVGGWPKMLGDSSQKRERSGSEILEGSFYPNKLAFYSGKGQVRILKNDLLGCRITDQLGPSPVPTSVGGLTQWASHGTCSFLQSSGIWRLGTGLSPCSPKHWAPILRLLGA